jgi:DNA-binding response OmpR family regulator
MVGKGYGLSSPASIRRGGIRVRERVVLALNDTVLAAWIARQLRRLGWAVHSTQSGEEARRLRREHSPQVVVLDIQLKDQTGWLTCEKILRDDPTLKVILFSSQSEINGEAFAEFLGSAKWIPQDQGSQAVINEIVATISAVS